jgi:Sulfotransferase family
MSPVKRHGFVEKLGAVPIERWHPSLETERRKSIREAVRSGELMIDGLPTMPPVSKCQIFVNHDYKFFYLRHPKSASTSIMNLFGVCDPADDRGPNVPNRTSCMRLYNKEEIDINDTTAYSALWKEYLVFTAVRNPFSRLLSTHRFELHLVKDTCEDLKEMVWR